MPQIEPFDAHGQPTLDEKVVIPPGRYKAAIIDSKCKENSRGTGEIMLLFWEVMDGPQAGRVVVDFINITHTNREAMEFGRKRLASICQATGVMRLQCTEELHGVPVMLTVGIKDVENRQMNSIEFYAPAASVTSPAWTPPQASRPTTRPIEPRQGNHHALPEEDIPF